MEVRIRYTGYDQIIRSLGRLNRLLSADSQTPKEIVAEEVISTIHTAFDTQRSPEGTPWKSTNDGRPALKGLRNTFFAAITKRQVTIKSTRPAEVAAHDVGMEIKAKKQGGLLALPFSRDLRPTTDYRTAYPNAFVLPSKRIDRLYLVEPSGKNTLRFIALLLYAVQMPKRGIFPTQLPGTIIPRLQFATQSIWEGK